MNNAAFWLRFTWQRLGRPGRLGLILVVASLGVWLFKVLPAEREAASVSSQLVDAQREAQRQASTKQGMPTLASFYRHFPDIAAVPDDLAIFNDAAEQSDLAIVESQYQLQEVPGLKLQRYQVSLPLDGDYPALRGFLSKVLQRLPHAALDEVRFERDEQSDVVTARLRFSLYYKVAK
ncbi:hypothetical protein HNQ59_003656 [Chitinivorax tropicus]|uniref:Pilus assembly protein PilO n=1 Tax=Chitinivorax tropicus TaxID=714531 RepID=A0A840MT10_9PROT|nr:hypothetical protein [Chitinivorax tropicus]MBB5020337.1 hypothetical protein [Chitinivorax tropicus]